MLTEGEEKRESVLKSGPMLKMGRKRPGCLWRKTSGSARKMLGSLGVTHGECERDGDNCREVKVTFRAVANEG